MQIQPTEWPRVSALLDEVLDLDAGARAVWLDELARSEPRLAPALRELLTHAAALETGDFLTTLAPLGLTAGMAVPPPDAPQPGAAFGGYILDEEIGRGGMGIVYRAHRADGLINRPVALKLLHPGVHSSELMARFARERDILARLTHPHIARLYDAGFAGAQQPYIALEFIEGTPLLAYCDTQRLTLRARLELFDQVLRAVHFAHSNLVIHRDLKPSNILVTHAGEVRLLDFGIAKLLPEASAPEPALTEFGGSALTPDYSAPEQIAKGPITTATDVYGAGVVLYELLTGLRPYRLPRRSRGALEDAILAAEPIEPSRAAITPELARLRDATPEKLRRQLAGDLDTILAKALKKDPRERYSSADAMHQDVQRYLRGEALLARPDRSWYRARKFIARHKLPVALAAALAVAVVTGLGAALWALGAARAQTARAEAAKSFLLEVFSTGNPSNTEGKNITASEILERGSRQIDARLQGQPALLGELHSEIASIYSSLGANEDVLRHAQRAARLLEESGDKASEPYFNALFRVASALKEEEHWPQARAAYERLRSAASARWGRVNIWEARSLEDLLWIEAQNGRLGEAQQAATEALGVARALYGERSSVYLRILGSSEQLYLDRGEPQQALALTERLIELAPSVPAYALADRLMDRYMHASTLYRLQRYPQSRDELQRLVPEMEANMGLGNDRTCKARNTLALDLMQLGDLGEALAVQQRNLDLLHQAHVGDEDLLVGQTATLTRILARAGRLAEAIPAQRQVVAHFDARYASPTPFRELVRAALGDMLLRDGQTAEGLENLTRSLANLDSISGFQPEPNYVDALLAQGNGYRLAGASARAASALDRACLLYRKLLGAESIALRRCQLYQLMNAGVPSEPAARREQLRQFEALRDELLAVLPPHQPLRAELLLLEAGLRRAAGATAAASALEAQGTQSYRALVGAEPSLPLRALH